MNIVCQLFALADPCGLQSVAEGLQLRNQVRVRNRKWSILANVLELGAVDSAVIVVINRLGSN